MTAPRVAFAAGGLAVWALLALLHTPLQAATDDDGALARKLQSVATLIETSSAARQIDTSGVAAAREKRDNARLVHREAAAALAAGDADGARRLLDEAAREMMAGVRLARPEQVTAEKTRLDYEARLGSARALLAAQQRITQEKQAGPAAAEAATSIEARIAQAQALAAQGRYEQARPLLDGAYLQARVSIESLRRGDTLVRSLSFASAAEEVAYEVDRNDAHRLLVQVVLSDRPDMRTMMQPLLDRADGLRATALAAAGRGEHAAAIEQLERSTRELVRAIRAGGLYIPG